MGFLHQLLRYSATHFNISSQEQASGSASLVIELMMVLASGELCKVERGCKVLLLRAGGKGEGEGGLEWNLSVYIFLPQCYFGSIQSCFLRISKSGLFVLLTLIPDLPRLTLISIPAFLWFRAFRGREGERGCEGEFAVKNVIFRAH